MCNSEPSRTHPTLTGARGIFYLCGSSLDDKLFIRQLLLLRRERHLGSFIMARHWCKWAVPPFPALLLHYSIRVYALVSVRVISFELQFLLPFKLVQVVPLLLLIHLHPLQCICPGQGLARPQAFVASTTSNCSTWASQVPDNELNIDEGGR